MIRLADRVAGKSIAAGILAVLAAAAEPESMAAPTSPPAAPAAWQEAVTAPGPIDLTSIPILEGQRPGTGSTESEGAHPMTDTAREQRSTWTPGGSDASYTLARWHLDHRRLPPADTIRVQELADAFTPEDPTTTTLSTSLGTELFPSPTRAGFHLLKIDLRAAASTRPDADVVVVVEVSDSLEVGSPLADGNLALAEHTLRQLAETLGDRDRLGWIAHGPRGRMIQHPVPMARRHVLAPAIRNLRPSPHTDLDRNLRLAYAMLERLDGPGRSQRIFLLSDGAADLPPSEALFAVIRRQAEGGRLLSTLALPDPAYDPALLRRLARWGDGRYAVLDHPAAIRRWLAENLDASLRLAARDVVCQVELDPRAVSRYRLLGDRSLSSAPTPGDRFLAGDLGDGQMSTALYEIQLAVPRLARLGTIRVRYHDPRSGELRRLEAPLAPDVAPNPSSAALLTWITASFGEKLVDSYWARGREYSDLLRAFSRLEPEVRTAPPMAELRYLLKRARSLDRRDRADPGRTEPGAAAPGLFDHLRILD